VLADVETAWELLVFPEDARNLDRTALFLARLGVGDAASLRRTLRERRGGRLAPVVVAEDLSWQQVAAIRSHQSNYPELSVIRQFLRHYPGGSVTAHAVGYLRPVTEQEVSADRSLQRDALVGATGVEAVRNEVLAGITGERWLVISAVGQQLGVVRERTPVAGEDLTLTVDLRLQQVAAEALGDHAGAVVALDPDSGAIRVLYSAPSFDPNIFVGRLSSEAWEALRSDPQHPMQNRCTQGVYPPGSTIKPFLALGGLFEGHIDPTWGVVCQGGVTLYGHPFRCWVRSGHGRVGLERSLEVSCDVFYYMLGQRLGIHRMAHWLRQFGFGQPTGADFSGERVGLVGTPEWKRQTRNEPWYPGEAVSVSIGQGPLDATPLQVARAFAALANGGWLVTPHLVAGRGREPPRRLPFTAEQLELVREGLRRAVHGSRGTARILKPLPVAGKTGTAQVARLQVDVELADLDPRLRHHAWFVGWAPLDEPEIVVAVLVEHGGGGGSVAAPVAGKVFAAALEGID
jgi:penicillin-binding protein 2